MFGPTVWPSANVFWLGKGLLIIPCLQNSRVESCCINPMHTCRYTTLAVPAHTPPLSRTHQPSHPPPAPFPPAAQHSVQEESSIKQITARHQVSDTPKVTAPKQDALDVLLRTMPVVGAPRVVCDAGARSTLTQHKFWKLIDDHLSSNFVCLRSKYVPCLQQLCFVYRCSLLMLQ